jgi:hypothetical protein
MSNDPIKEIEEEEEEEGDFIESMVLQKSLVYGLEEDFHRFAYQNDSKWSCWTNTKWIGLLVTQLTAILGLGLYCWSGFPPVGAFDVFSYTLWAGDYGFNMLEYSSLSVCASLVVSIICSMFTFAVILFGHAFVSSQELKTRPALLITVSVFLLMPPTVLLTLLINEHALMWRLIISIVVFIFSFAIGYIAHKNTMEKLGLTNAFLNVFCSSVLNFSKSLLISLFIFFIHTCVTFYLISLSLSTSQLISPLITLIYLIPTYIWISQVLKLINAVFLSGSLSHVYFNAKHVQNPLFKSFKRSISTSLGSICFAAVILPLEEFYSFLQRMKLRFVLRDSSDALFCAYTKYTPIQFALYGKEFQKARSHSKKILHIKGFHPILKECFSNHISMILSLIFGIFLSVLVLGYFFWFRSNNLSLFGKVELSILVSTIGYCSSNFLFETIFSGIPSLIILWAEDGSSLKNIDNAMNHISSAVWRQVPSFGYYVS